MATRHYYSWWRWWFDILWVIFTRLRVRTILIVLSLQSVGGWLQGRVVHFLRHNSFFCRVACIYMLLTWHKNNNFLNLWLDLDCQLEEKKFYKKIVTYIHQKYSNGLLKLKNMDWFVVCASIYMHFCVWILFGIYYKDSIYDMLKQKEHMCKNITRKI